MTTTTAAVVAATTSYRVLHEAAFTDLSLPVSLRNLAEEAK